MTALEQQVKRMNEKLQQLLKQYYLLQKENERLRQEVHQASNNYKIKTEESDKWQQQAEILKLSKEQMNDEEKRAFEKRLNQYVREIDRCIALLAE